MKLEHFEGIALKVLLSNFFPRIGLANEFDRETLGFFLTILTGAYGHSPAALVRFFSGFQVERRSETFELIQ